MSGFFVKNYFFLRFAGFRLGAALRLAAGFRLGAALRLAAGFRLGAALRLAAGFRLGAALRLAAGFRLGAAAIAFARFFAGLRAGADFFVARFFAGIVGTPFQWVVCVCISEFDMTMVHTKRSWANTNRIFLHDKHVRKKFFCKK